MKRFRLALAALAAAAMITAAFASSASAEVSYHLQSKYGTWSNVVSPPFAEGALRVPSGMDTDASGNLWIADFETNRVLELTASGTWSTQITGSGEHKLESPKDVAVDDSTGNLWIAEPWVEKVVEFNTKGEFIREAKTGFLGFEWIPTTVAVDSKGNVWAGSWLRNPSHILKFNSSGERLKTEVIDPSDGLAVDSEDHLWVANYEKERIDKYSAEGAYLGQIGEGTLIGPWELMFDGKGNLWTTVGYIGGKVYVQGLKPNGESVAKFGDSSWTSENGGGPNSLAPAKDGSIWTGKGTNGGQIQKWSPSVSDELIELPVTEPFDGSATSEANFKANWLKLGWASEKGLDTTTGWRANGAYPIVNGTYFNSTVTDVGRGEATVVTMGENPGNKERYFSMWLDASGSASTREGYELRFTDVSSNTYNVKLSKWKGGTETLLASKSSYSFVNGNSLALLDQGGTVSAWTKTGTEFTQLLSASDEAFASGKAGIEAAGNRTNLLNFKAGAF